VSNGSILPFLAADVFFGRLGFVLDDLDLAAHD
jgi:hypothetical protein